VCLCGLASGENTELGLSARHAGLVGLVGDVDLTLGGREEGVVLLDSVVLCRSLLAIALSKFNDYLWLWRCGLFLAARSNKAGTWWYSECSRKGRWSNWGIGSVGVVLDRTSLGVARSGETGSSLDFGLAR